MTILQQRSRKTGHPVAIVTGKPKCFCNRDFTVDEIRSFYENKNLFKAKNCPLPSEEKNFESLTKFLNQTMNKFEINTCLRKAHFLAQIYTESDHLQTSLEYATGWDYDPSTHEKGYNEYSLYLKDKIVYAQNKKSKRHYNRYKECIAHGHKFKGDGPKYKGRGLIQLTWKDNYIAFFSSLGYDYDIDKPEIVSDQLELSCLSAGWFWTNGSALEIKDLNIHADNDDLISISFGINGGDRGFLERKNNTKKIIKLMNIKENCVNLNLESIGTYRFKNSYLFKVYPSRIKMFEKYDD